MLREEAARVRSTTLRFPVFFFRPILSLQMCVVVGWRAFVLIRGISLSLAVWLVVVRDFKKEEEKKDSTARSSVGSRGSLILRID